MSTNLINLSKQVDIVLAKRNIPSIKAQVGAALDVSGSARPLYENGTMERVLNRVYALAFKFDDNQVLDSWVFHNAAQPVTSIEQSMFNNYVEKHIMRDGSVSKWGGTEYAPLLQLINNHYMGEGATQKVEKKGLFGGLFGSKKEAAPAPTSTAVIPAYNIIVTDGVNSDRQATEAVFRANQDKGVYYQFVAVSNGYDNPDFSFLIEMADKYGNVGFLNADNIDKMSDNTLYEELLNPEFVQWYQNKVKA